MATVFFRPCVDCVNKVEHIHATEEVVANRWNGGEDRGIIVSFAKPNVSDDQLLVGSDGEVITVAELTAQRGLGKK